MDVTDVPIDSHLLPFLYPYDINKVYYFYYKRSSDIVVHGNTAKCVEKSDCTGRIGHGQSADT